jgi:hypothetical protein
VCYAPDGSVFCDDTTSVGRIFDSRLSYSKGAMLLHMLRWVVGDEAFFTGIGNYLNDPDLRHGFARTTDFKQHIEATSGKDLTGFFADWYFGQGFPTYTVNVGQSPDNICSVTIYQEQSHPSVNFFEMPVPVQFFGAGTDTVIVFDHTFSGQVFSANPGFRVDSVKFDPEMWLVSANNEVTLGKEDLPFGKSLLLLPNPASDYLYIQHNLGKINSLEILSMEGKAELTNSDAEGDLLTKINIKNLKPGMYILRIVYPEGKVTRKFVVNR